jgi:hypothetical protein
MSFPRLSGRWAICKAGHLGGQHRQTLAVQKVLDDLSHLRCVNHRSPGLARSYRLLMIY